MPEVSPVTTDPPLNASVQAPEEGKLASVQVSVSPPLEGAGPASVRLPVGNEVKVGSAVQEYPDGGITANAVPRPNVSPGAVPFHT